MPAVLGYVGAFAAIILFIGIASAMEHRNAKKQFEANIKNRYGKFSEREYEYEEYERITHYFLNNTDVEDYYIDDITWNDLDMNDLNQMMNQCNSSAGDSILYHMLRRPCEKVEELNRREKIITWFQNHKEQREEMQFLLARMGRTKKIAFTDYMDNIVTLPDRSNWIHYFCLLLIPVAIAIFIAEPSIGLVPIIVVVIFNNIIYSKKKAEIEAFVICFEYILRMLEAVKKCDRIAFEEIEPLKQDLKKTAATLKSFQAGAGMVMSIGRSGGSMEEAIVMYLRMIFHFDLIKFNQMLKVVKTKTKECESLFWGLGEIDACIAIASFRETLPYYAVPDLSETNKRSMVLEEVYHPMIPNAVSNSIVADKGVLITGSNASGKSTFLKVVAINAIFAQTIHTAIAKRYVAPVYHIYSSMSLRDSIQGSESYYMVEIRSLKRILNAKRGLPVLCFVDEVLRGTNTVERIAASTEILKSISDGSFLCFAATHDVELTHLLEAEYDNYHFEEEIVEDDVHFSYQIHQGRATTRNAIKLLNMMGYDKAIVYNAEKRATDFLEQGVWR